MTRYTDQEVHMPFAPSDEAAEFAALVAGRLLYDLYASQYNATLSISEDLARMSHSLLTLQRKARWSDLDTAEQQKWLDRGKEAVRLVVELEAMGR